MKNTQIEPRMYRENKETLGEKKMSNGFVIKKKSATVAYGVDTNAISRKQMFDMLPEIVQTEYDKFVSPNIYADLTTLEKKKNGKIEHSDGGHDDSLMAYLIFRYAVFYGKCFRDKFGISPIPSRMNVKVVSSEASINRISQLIMQANDGVSQVSVDQDFSLDNYKTDETQKQSNENKQLSAFLDIINLNK